MSLDNFSIKTEAFEGPLDLLLDMIEKRKLFVNDISLAKVTDDFVAYVQTMGTASIGMSAEFILIASTLLLIKSKSLLPTINLTEEEHASIEDLEERLKIYQRVRELAVHVKDRFGKNIIFERNVSKKIDPVFSPDSSMTIPALFAAMKEVLQNIPKKEYIPKAVVRKVISLEEMISDLTERVKKSLRMSFKEFARGSQPSLSSGEAQEVRVNIIVSFLAMLELVKQGIILVTQEKDFEDIHIETKEIGVPHYN